MTDPTETKRPNRPTRYWRGFVAILMTPVQTYVAGLLLAGIVIFAGGAYLFDRQADADGRARQDALQRREVDDYLTAHDQWRTTLNGYNACLVTVDQSAETNIGIRTLLYAFADLSDVLPGEPRAEAYTVNRQSLVDTLYPPVDVALRKLERCEPIAPGPEPVDPRIEEDS